MAKSKPDWKLVRLVGTQMSNLCFNLAQSDDIPTQYRKTMRELYQRWDAAISGRGEAGEKGR